MRRERKRGLRGLAGDSWDFAQVDHFVTDRPPPDKIADICRHNGVEVDVVAESAGEEKAVDA